MEIYNSFRNNHKTLQCNEQIIDNYFAHSFFICGIIVTNCVSRKHLEGFIVPFVVVFWFQGGSNFVNISRQR